MHQSILQKLYGGSGVPASRCTSCNSKDVKRKRYGQTYTWKFQNRCPLSLCDTWLTELLTFHTNPTSSRIFWENCDVTAWPCTSWECAKLYMPQGQPPTNTGPDKCDSQALLKLMAKCKYFHSKLSAGGLQLTYTVSKIRNTVMHSEDMSLSDSDRKSFIQDIINLLEDPSHLKSLEECKLAVAEINKINNDSLDLFYGAEMEVLSDCINDCRQELGLPIEETEKTVDALKTILKDLQVQLKRRVMKLSSDLEALKSEVKTIKKIADTDRRKQKKINRKLLKQRTTKVIKARDQVSEKEIKSDIQPFDLQPLLIKAYKSVQIISVSQVFESIVNPTDLEDINIDIVIEEKTEASTQMNKDVQQVSKKKVTSFRQIFYKDDKKVTRIILKAPAGQGKSTFCRKLVHTWCSVQNKKLDPDINARTADKSQTNGLKDEDEMLRFDVLLYICLRYISEEKTLMDAVYNQFPLHESQGMLHRSHIEALIGQAEDNKVLLIMDGLDEIDNSISFIEKIMQRNLYPHLTVIATTRPGKMDQLSQSGSSHLNLLLDLQGFSYENSILFSNRIFDNCYKDKSVIPQFECNIKENLVIRRYIHIPPLLHFIIHVWHEKKSFPQTIHELYLEILNVMVNRYMEDKEKKQKGMERHDEENSCLQKTWQSMTFLSTSLLRNLSLVQHFGEEFLAVLCEVANCFSFRDVKERSHVFEENDLVDLFGMEWSSKLQTAQDLQILSKPELSGKYGKKICLTFPFETVKEILVAINLCCRENSCNIFLNSINKVEDVLQNEMIIMLVAGISASHCVKKSEKIYEVCDTNMHPDSMRTLFNYSHNLCRLYRECVREAIREPISLKLNSLCAGSQHEWNVLQSALRSKSDVRLIGFKCLTYVISVDISEYSQLTHIFLEDSKLDDSNSKLHWLESTSLTMLSLHRVTVKCELLLSNCIQLKDLKLAYCDFDDATLDLSKSTSMNELILEHVTMKGKLLSTSLTKLSLANVTLKGEMWLSNCTHLKSLELAYCSFDDVRLDLSESTCLTALNIYSVVMKGKLLLSKCARLEILKLTRCSLDDATLDMSESTSLIEFVLESVKMKSELLLSNFNQVMCLLLPKCTRLKYLKLALCRLNAVTLDLSKCTSLTELSLNMVSVSGKLSLSKCTSLKQLQVLKCRLDDATLDLSESTSLTELKLNKVTMNGKLSLSKCTQLKQLDVAHCRLDDATLDLSESTSLTELKLNKVTMNGKLSLSKCTQLKQLDVAHCRLDDVTLDLTESANLTVFLLQSVTMNGKLLLSKCPQLKRLELTSCSLDEATLDLSESTSLTMHNKPLIMKGILHVRLPHPNEHVLQ